MDLQSGKCPSCGGSEIQALPGGSLRCTHCGTYYADASRQVTDKPSVHVHVHGLPPSAPAQDYPPQQQYAQPQYPQQQYAPQYPAPMPVAYYPVQQRKGMNGCLIAFIVVSLLGVLGCIGLGFLGYAAEQAAPNPYSTTSESSSATSAGFSDVQNAINANDISRLRQMLDQNASLATSTGRVDFTSWEGITTTLTGTTPLHIAAFNGNIEAVRLLLTKGADPHAVAWPDGSTGYGATALDLAEEMGQQQVVDELNTARWGSKGG